MATTAGLFSWGWGVLRFGDVTRMAGSTSCHPFLECPFRAESKALDRR